MPPAIGIQFDRHARGTRAAQRIVTFADTPDTQTFTQRKLTKSLCSVVTDRATPGDHLLAFEAKGSKLTGFSYLIWA